MCIDRNICILHQRVHRPTEVHPWSPVYEIMNSHILETSGRPDKTQIAGPWSQHARLSRSRVDPWISKSKKFPGNSDAAGLGTTLWEPLLEDIIHLALKMWIYLKSRGVSSYYFLTSLGFHFSLIIFVPPFTMCPLFAMIGQHWMLGCYLV